MKFPSIALTIITKHFGFHFECKVAEGAKPITNVNDVNLSFFNLFLCSEIKTVLWLRLSLHLLKRNSLEKFYLRNTKLLFCLQPSRDDKFKAEINKERRRSQENILFPAPGNIIV